MARVYVQQTFGLGGEQETIEDGPNQIAGKKDISRITIIAGKFAVTDFFDNNAYAQTGERNSSTGMSIAAAPTTGPWTRSAIRGAPWPN